MPRDLRYNTIVDLLEQAKPAFIAGTVSNGSLDELTLMADSDYDGVIIDTELEGFNFATLRLSLQCLLNRKCIAAPVKTTLVLDVGHP
ncbi:MAG TPA: hypothetical protein VNP04_02765 [Alphaproteobacteria bacterium]|nr:hypothetical protein [Alphaproteobacteria bacterium]